MKINATWKQTRDDGERWLGKRPQGPDGELVEVEVKFNEVNLYDLDKYVIRPATEEKQCAMVELMASGEQPPDFFVSHFWAEPILEFFKCLLEHSWARGFESKREGSTMGSTSMVRTATSTHSTLAAARRATGCAHTPTTNGPSRASLSRTSRRRRLRAPCVSRWALCRSSTEAPAASGASGASTSSPIRSVARTRRSSCTIL